LAAVGVFESAAGTNKDSSMEDWPNSELARQSFQTKESRKLIRKSLDIHHDLLAVKHSVALPKQANNCM